MLFLASKYPVSVSSSGCGTKGASCSSREGQGTPEKNGSSS